MQLISESEGSFLATVIITDRPYYLQRGGQQGLRKAVDFQYLGMVGGVYSNWFGAQGPSGFGFLL